MDGEIDIKRIFKTIYKRRNILIYVLDICLVIGMLYTFLIKSPIYEVKAQILIDKADASIENFVASKDIVQSNEITTTFNKNTKIITVKTEMNNKEESFDKTNNCIKVLKEKLEDTYEIKTFNIIETPKMPEKAVNATYVKDIIFTLVLGVGLYIACIVVIAIFRGATSETEIKENLKLNTLGKIKLEEKDIKNQNENKSQEENLYEIKNKYNLEQMKRIQTNLELNKENQKPKTVLLTGTKSKVGTSYVVNNLANQYSKLYNKIIIVDANMINKTLTNELLQNEEKGLTDIIACQKEDEIENYIKTTKNSNISVLANGKETIQEEMFLKENITKIINKLKEAYDIVLIDTNSINENILPIRLSSIVDSTIIVVEAGKTKLEEVAKAKTTIENVGGKISGVIINKTL